MQCPRKPRKKGASAPDDSEQSTPTESTSQVPYPRDTLATTGVQGTGSSQALCADATQPEPACGSEDPAHLEHRPTRIGMADSDAVSVGPKPGLPKPPIAGTDPPYCRRLGPPRGVPPP
jgi:hypothetical protein